MAYIKNFLASTLSLWKRASTSKRPRVDLIPFEEALERIFNEEDSADGMESGEESDLDRQLENKTAESR